jgi:peptide/nickel transport system substrate-binding protein
MHLKLGSRWVGAVAALSLLLAGVAACSSKASTAQSQSSNTLVIAIPHDVETLDSDFSHYPLSNEVNYNTQDQYFIYGMKSAPGGYSVENVDQFLPKSIQSWKLAPNGKSVVLNIQRGDRFCHTGDPVTAADFLYYFNRGIHTKSGYLFNIQGAYIKSWKQLSPYSFELFFSKPSPFFFELFRDQSEAPVDVAAIQKHTTAGDPWATSWKAKHDAGSGPYCVTKWVPGAEMDLTANPYFKGPGKPHYKHVVLKVVPDSAERALLLKEGTVDVAEDLTTDELNELHGASGIKVISAPSRDQYEMGMNNKVAPFNNRLVRQALSYAVPYQSIIKGAFGGRAVLPQGAIPVNGEMFNASTWPYTYDLAKAKALLKQAGYPHGFSFTLDITSGDAVSQELAVSLQSAFKSIGVQMTINTQTAAVFAQKLDTKTHQAWMEDVLWYVNDPAYIGNSFYLCGALLNWTNYCNPAVDKTIQQMLSDWRPSDRAQKEAAATQMQRLINTDAPTLVVAEPNLQVAMSSGVTGYVDAPDEELLYNYLRPVG